MNESNDTSHNAVDYFIERHMQAGHAAWPAILELGRAPVCYQELQERVAQAGHCLLSLGVKQEQRVALLMPDCREFVYFFFGALKIGAVAVPLNTYAQLPLLVEYLRDSRAAALIVDPRYADTVLALKRANALKQVRVISDTVRFSQWPNQLTSSPVHADDTAFWLYTSGSTGQPKGVEHRHASLRICAENYGAQVLRIAPQDVSFSTSKLFFAYGLGNSLLFPFAAGAACVLNPDTASANVIRTHLKTFKPTLFFSVPSLYNQWLKTAELTAADFSCVRMCISAGEFLPEKLFDAWKARFAHCIYDGIGSTEALHIFCSNRTDAWRAGSSGVPVPGYELRLVDENNQPVACGQVGRLMVKGETLAKNYWNRYHAAKLAFYGEWLATGDLYRVDQDGFYSFAGRVGDAFKSSGLWVSPVEIEQALLQHPLIAEAAVIASTNADGLCAAKAFIVPDGALAGLSAAQLTGQLHEFLKERLAAYKLPHAIVALAALPKTATGKIARAALRTADCEEPIFAPAPGADRLQSNARG